MWYKRSRQLHVLLLLSALGHVVVFVWVLPWLATLPPGRPHAMPVRIAVVTPDTASRVPQSEADATSTRPQPVIRPVAAPLPAPVPTLQDVTKSRPQPPPPPQVAEVKSPTAKPSPSRHRPHTVRPRLQKGHKRPISRPSVPKRQPVAPPPSPSPSPSQLAVSSTPAVAETPMKPQQRPALPAGAGGAEHPESPARTPGKPAAVASLPPPQGWVPRFAYKPCPRYPYIARRRRVEGTVTLRFAVRSAGTIGDVQVVQSSGNALLDDAAQKAVRAWRPLPDKESRRGNTWVHVPFTFALTAPNGSNGHSAPGVPAGPAAINCDAGAKP